MLKKINRLSKVREFRANRTIQGKTIVLKISEENNLAPRFAFIVSKKIDKRAVIRNKIKRKLSKSIEEVLEKIQNRNYLIIAKKELLNDNNKNEMKLILEKENLLK